MDTVSSRGRMGWLVPALLVALGLVPSMVGIARLIELAGHPVRSPANIRFVVAPVPVVLHVVTVIPFALLGALQFAPAFRRRGRRWHRVAGVVVALCGLTAALTGVWMACSYPWPEGDGAMLFLLRIGFGSAMFTAILLGITAIRRGDIVSHGEWMMRGYSIGMGAGTQVLTHLPWMLLIGKPDESTRAVLMGAGWVINLWIAELIIRTRRERWRRDKAPTRTNPPLDSTEYSWCQTMVATPTSAHESPRARPRRNAPTRRP